MDEKPEVKIENHNDMHNCNVFLGPTYGGVFPLPGSQPVINNYYGAEQKKTEKQRNDKAPEAEDADRREQHRKDVMADITKLFDFSNEQLGRSPSGRRLSNDDIRLLFCRVFGLRDAHPSASMKETMEQMWALLIDKRNQCFKTDGEGFIRQTVLNIIGYFAERNLLQGAPLELAKSVFSDADAGIAKNVTRGISSNVFPDDTKKIIDTYIKKIGQ